MSEQIKRPRAVVFDLTATLLDKKQLVEVDQYVARNFFERDLTEAAIAAQWRRGKSPQEFYPAIFGLPAEEWELGRELVVRHSQNPQFNRQLVPGAFATLAVLRDAGIKLGIFTGGPRSMVNKFIDQAQLPERDFMFIHTGDETDADVAAGRTPLTAARNFLIGQGIEPADTLVVGDEPSDMRAADRAGMDFVAVTSGFVTAEEHIAEGVPPSRVIAGVHELPALFGIVPPTHTA